MRSGPPSIPANLSQAELSQLGEALVIKVAPIRMLTRLEWILLSALGSTMLLATTTQISQDIAAIPLLWVLHLSVYLISFIICFDHDKWYVREFWIPCFVISLSVMLSLMYDNYLDIHWEIAVQLAALFSACMICHGELVGLRPVNHHLTDFYLSVSLGGALGGVFVNLIAPQIFSDYWEFYWVIFAISLLVVVQAFRKRCWFTPGNLTQQYILLTVAVSIGLPYLVYTLLDLSEYRDDHPIIKTRNFYGTLKVTEERIQDVVTRRTLYHGIINHGSQWLLPEYRNNAYAYYGVGSGVEKVVRYHPKRLKNKPLKVGVVGLGIGVVAAYGKAGDQFKFYEINQDVVDIAKNNFAYLFESKAEIEIVLGDGRVSMENELSRGLSNAFDVLIIDAFSGDAIPVHLLTEEAADIYAAQLAKNNGVIVVHVSNLYLDLELAVLGMANHLQRKALYVKQWSDEDKLNANSWVIVTNSAALMAHPKISNAVTPWADDKPAVSWSDDFSNIFEAITK